MFPIRDFIEILFFSYLFYLQSKKKRDLAHVNETWRQSETCKSPARLRKELKHLSAKHGNPLVQHSMS